MFRHATTERPRRSANAIVGVRHPEDAGRDECGRVVGPHATCEPDLRDGDDDRGRSRREGAASDAVAPGEVMNWCDESVGIPWYDEEQGQEQGTRNIVPMSCVSPRRDRSCMSLDDEEDGDE